MVTKLSSIKTHGKQSQTARLTESVELVQSLMQSAGIGIYIAQDGNLVYVNSLFHQLIGRSKDELIGECFLDFVHPDDREIVQEKAIESLNRQDVLPYEYRFSKKNGAIIWVLERVTSIEYRGKRATIGSFMDITERKEAEEALVESEERYRTMLEGIEEGYYEVGLSGDFTFFNNSLCRITGYSKEDLTGVNYRDYTIEKDFEAVYKAFNRVYRTGKPAEGLSWRALRKNGEEVFFEASALPSRNASGEIVGFRGLVRDITERKKVEEERKHLVDRLSIKTKELENIIYITSHDLRSPLVNIQGFTKEIDNAFGQARSIINTEDISPEARERLAMILEDEIPDAFEYILKSTSKIDALISGLLQLSRLGRTELTIESLDMNKVLQDITSNFEFRIKQIGATIKVEDLPFCYGDGPQVNQVFSNLLGNALKFLDPNRPGMIRISGSVENGQSIYCVEDNGIGIEEEHKERVFEIFHRVCPEFCPGEGLGLTIIQNIMERHDGKIWVESELGKGSKFFITIPAIKRY